MKEIELTQGLVALVDDEDYTRVAAVRWHVAHSKRYGTRYAVHSLTGGGLVAMHRFILRLSSNDPPVDHINRNGLDNTRGNIRVSDARQNCLNRGMQKSNSSGYRGVSFHKRIGKWQAYVTDRGLRRYLGYFDGARSAAMAYDAAAVVLHGRDAQPNFPTVPAAPDADPSRPAPLPSSRASEDPR